MKYFFQKKKTTDPSGRRRVSIEGARPQMYAYRASRSHDRAAAGRRSFRSLVNTERASRALRFSARRFGVIALTVAALASLVSVLALSSDPKIVQDGDSSQTAFLRSPEVYRQAAQKLFAGSLLNRSKLTADTGGIGMALKRKFPELSSVAVTLPLIDHRPLIYLKRSEPVLALVASSGRSYLIDSQGYAIAEASGTAATSLPRVKDENPIAVYAGERVLPSSTVSFIRSVVFQLSRQRISVSTFVLPAGMSELDAYLYGQKYFIKFNLASVGTVREQAGAFLAVQHYLAGRGKAPRQYVDVRVGGRAYYK